MGNLLTTQDVADFFQKSVDWVRHSYPKWIVEYGIKPFRLNGNPKGHPMWHRSDIEKLPKLWTVDACLEKKGRGK